MLFERLLVPAPAPLATQRSPLASQSTLTRTVQTLIFAGTLLLMGAVSWLARSSYEHNGWVVSLPIVGVLLVALLVGAEISLRKGADALAACFGAAAIVYMPSVAYGFLHVLGFGFAREYHEFWPWIREGWIALELSAIVFGAAVWWRIRRPFVTFPIVTFVALLAIDGGTRLFGRGDGRAVTVATVGGVLVGVGIFLDNRGFRRHAFWPHLAGMYALSWGGGVLIDDTRLGLLVSGIAFVLVGIWLARAWHLAVGGLIVWGVLSSNASTSGVCSYRECCSSAPASGSRPVGARCASGSRSVGCPRRRRTSVTRLRCARSILDQSDADA